MIKYYKERIYDLNPRNDFAKYCKVGQHGIPQSNMEHHHFPDLASYKQISKQKHVATLVQTKTPMKR